MFEGLSENEDISKNSFISIVVHIVSMMRIKHYFKNISLFVPAFIHGILLQKSTIDLCITFIGFSLLCSAVYIINDISDRKHDKNHPSKQFRPIPVGKISIPVAVVFCIVLAVTGFSIIYLIDRYAFYFSLIYFVVNVLYSLSLKHKAIIDVIIIACGFVLRLFIGSAVVNVVVDHWIVMLTFVASLFLAVTKRRDDMILYIESKKKNRKVIDQYNLSLLDFFISILATSSIIIYILYTVSPTTIAVYRNQYLYLTTIFIIIVLFRYIKITVVHHNSGNPVNIIVNDVIIKSTLLIWGAVMFLLLYM
jgi:4-hydroxybenzoate polyprenyltransferase